MANVTFAVKQPNGSVLTVSGVVDEAQLAVFAPQLANLLVTVTTTLSSTSTSAS